MLCSLGASPSRVRAQEDDAASSPSGAIVIVRSQRDQRVVRRVRAELEGWAVPVIELGPDAESQSAPLIELARRHAAQAVLRVHAAEQRVELWVARPRAAPDGTLDTIIADGLLERGDEVLAVRVTEALRAWDLGPPAPVAPPDASPSEASLEPRDTPAVPEKRSPAQPADESAARSKPRRSARTDTTAARTPARVAQLWLELGPALALSPGGLGTQLQGWLSARWSATPVVSVAGVLLIPLVADRFESTEGSARFATWLLGAAADARLRLPPFELAAGAGAGLLIAQVSGSAAAPGLAPFDDSAFAAAPFGRSSIHLALGPNVQLCARAQLGMALPAIAMRFVDRDVARWGRPFVTTTLAVEVAF